MSEIETTLLRWKQSLPDNVSVGGLLARDPIANRWKAMYRSLVLRETIFWRTHDLLTQAHLLHQSDLILGSRILIRSALESVAILVYLNQLTARVLAGTLSFHSFSDKTRQLLIGSRDGSTKHSSINIVTILERGEKKYPGLVGIYATLSECAHPNFEGVCFGYSEIDFSQHQTNFQNKWAAMWADRHESLVMLVCTVFETEYNDVWAPQNEQLEGWVTANNAELEATKGEDA
jgi:hypothetical protein